MANDRETWVDARLDALGDGPSFDAARARAQVRPAKNNSMKWATVAIAGALLVGWPAGAEVWKRFFTMETVERQAARAPATDFALADANGKSVRLSDYRGQVVLLNFWATWCLPCQHEVPWFVDFASKYKDRGFTVLGVSMDEEGWAPVRAFLAEKHVNYPVVLAKPDELPAPYNAISMLPKTYLIDREGNIAGEYDGVASKEAYDKWLRSVLYR